MQKEGGHYDTLRNLSIRKSVYIHTPGCQALVPGCEIANVIEKKCIL